MLQCCQRSDLNNGRRLNRTDHGALCATKVADLAANISVPLCLVEGSSRISGPDCGQSPSLFLTSFSPFLALEDGKKLRALTASFLSYERTTIKSMEFLLINPENNSFPCSSRN